MPELPDVETFRRYFQKHALHRRIADVIVAAPEMVKEGSAGALGAALRGQVFRQAGRHGKYLLAATEGGGWLVLHFGMTGFLSYLDHPADIPPHVRLRILFDDGSALDYDNQRKFGEIRWTEDRKEFLKQKGLGPDALSSATDVASLLAPRRGSVKGALMDQSLVSGIGNVYADEILFQARVHPAAPVERLSPDDLERIAVWSRRVLETAIDHEADPESMPAGYLLPHRRKGEACPRCGGLVESLKVAGRTTYFCPFCQQSPWSCSST